MKFIRYYEDFYNTNRVHSIEDSSAGNGYFRGTFPNGEVFDLNYIHYDI